MKELVEVRNGYGIYLWSTGKVSVYNDWEAVVFESLGALALENARTWCDKN